MLSIKANDLTVLMAGDILVHLTPQESLSLRRAIRVVRDVVEPFYNSAKIDISSLETLLECLDHPKQVETAEIDKRPPNC